MIVSIRSDYCIALRMIALQEQIRQSEEFLNQLAKHQWWIEEMGILPKQEPLGEEFEKVLYDNLEELYVED